MGLKGLNEVVPIFSNFIKIAKIYPNDCARGNFHCRAPFDVIHNVIVCKNYFFSNSQRFRLLFSVVENVLTQLRIQLAAIRRNIMI